LDQNPIHKIDESRWAVSSMMSLRRLGRKLDLELPETRSVTVGGVIQESMQRLAQVGDVCRWGPLQFRVVEIEHRGNMLIEMTIIENSEEKE
jgi:CBS domain containing-hemolysin-like protein